jgi:hypothetical protein
MVRFSWSEGIELIETRMHAQRPLRRCSAIALRFTTLSSKFLEPGSPHGAVTEALTRRCITLRHRISVLPFLRFGDDRCTKYQQLVAFL